MADFDAIYEDEEDANILEAPHIASTPDPVVVRGGGNITV